MVLGNLETVYLYEETDTEKEKKGGFGWVIRF